MGGGVMETFRVPPLVQLPPACSGAVRAGGLRGGSTLGVGCVQGLAASGLGAGSQGAVSPLGSGAHGPIIGVSRVGGSGGLDHLGDSVFAPPLMSPDTTGHVRSWPLFPRSFPCAAGPSIAALTQAPSLLPELGSLHRVRRASRAARSPVDAQSSDYRAAAANA